MRTLLIDNYDSYTYNLFQLIAQVNNTEPMVLRNDAPECTELDLDAFDNVVISPGPGHPSSARDFGASAKIVAQARIPLLGVCLGHQGIAAGEGSAVVRAPAARHGHLTTVRHDDSDLFRAIPQGFTAVRYHSLCVSEPLPHTLEATAWAEDGVVMGLRHRKRPLWGVQFHPESVATEFGQQLWTNFCDMTKRYHFAGGRARRTLFIPQAPASTSRRRQAHVPARKHNYRLHVRVIASLVDTEAAFTRLFAESPHSFWLDSSRVEPDLSRFSFLGDAAGPLAEVARYRVDEGVVEVTVPGQAPQHFQGSIFDYLQHELCRRSVDSPALPFDFSCGYVGYFGYELKADCGSKNTHRATTPDACWLFVDRMAAVDHETGTTYLLCLSDSSSCTNREATRWLDATTATLRSLGRPVPAAALASALTDTAALEPWLTRDRERYLADIAACKRQLLAGESYEICLTNGAWLPGPRDGLDFYRTLRRHNPAPYSAYLRLGDIEVASSSPERFLRVTRDRVVESKPIKGTAPRGKDQQDDTRLKDELTTSTKTRAENLMIVDLLRNDLGRVCEAGSVRVPQLMSTETYATMHQLVSTVRGRLRADTDVVECIRACFPGGSMTGAPKLRTLEIIDALETEARGVYSGAIGFLSCTGAVDLNIAIRTAVLVDGQLHVGAGGAIVLDSDPVEEYEEMLLKASAPVRALLAGGQAEPRDQSGAGRAALSSSAVLR